MTITFKRATTLLIALVSIVAFTLLTLPIIAQETSGSGLRISPTRTDLSLVPGDSREIIQTVRNVTQNAVTVEPILNDFESDGRSGEPRLIGDPDEVSAFSLREFISVPESFDLEPGEEQEVTISVIVPDNASPGAYFGSMLYRASPQGATGDGQVALIASVGSLVLLEVPGDITERIEIKDISAFLGDNSGSIFTKKPDAIGVEIENQGNSFSQPFGKVSVKDWRGNDVFLYELNDGAPRGNILPNSTRVFLNELFNVEIRTVNNEEVVDRVSPLTWPGRYSITGNISHGSTGEIFTVQSSFWYIPIWLIIFISALLVVVVGSAVYLYRKYLSRSKKRK